MTAAERERLGSMSSRITAQLAAYRDEIKEIKKERDLWKARALALAAAVELLETEMQVKK